MKLLSALNPFKFSRQYQAAWNALMAAYTFDELTSEQQDRVMDAVVEIESSVRRRPVTLSEIIAGLNEAQRFHLFSLAMMNADIRPAIGTDLWFEVKNPHVDLLDGEAILVSTKHQLEKQFGVEFPELSC